MAQQRTLLLTSSSLIILLLLSLVALATRPYNGNISALLHLDRTFGETYQVPAGIILYEDGGYDGMLYYQIARNIPQLFFGEAASPVPFYGNAYRTQRILLPSLAFLLTGGNASHLSLAILSINLTAVVLAFVLLAHTTAKVSLHTYTIVCNPAALVGILFSLTEPLNLLLIIAALSLFIAREERLDTVQVVLLSLAMLARETTLFLLLFLALPFLLRKEWKQVLLALFPLLPFALWQGFLSLRLGELPFATGTHMLNLPFIGTLDLLVRVTSTPNAYTLSSASFLLLFLFPLVAVQLRRSVIRGDRTALNMILTGLTLIMLLMDAHIWGVITSIGRVLSPLYPVYAVVASRHDTGAFRTLSAALITISITAAVGIATTTHPFSVS